MTSLGASMFNQSVIGLDRSLVYSTHDFTKAHQAIPCFNSLSLVRPHLEYASAIWSPHVKKDQVALKTVQNFACCMVGGGQYIVIIVYIIVILRAHDNRIVVVLKLLSYRVHIISGVVFAEIRHAVAKYMQFMTA